MKTQTIERIIKSRLSLAGLKPGEDFKKKMAAHLISQFAISKYLAELSDDKVFEICKPKECLVEKSGKAGELQ